MMPGAWLTAIGQRVFRGPTFETLVAPAIADLQFEAAMPRSRRWSHRLALIVVVGHGLLRDLHVDVLNAFDRDSWRVVWKGVAVWYVVLAGLFMYLVIRSNVPRDLGLDRFSSAGLLSASLQALISACALSIVPAVVYLHRRGASYRRSILAVVLIVSSCATGAAFATRPLKMRADRELYEAVSSVVPVGPQTPAAPFDSRLSASKIWLQYKSDDLDPQFARQRDIRGGVAVMVWALVGLVLARHRAWKMAAFGIGMAASHVWLGLTLLHYEVRLGLFPSRTMQEWRDIALQLTTVSLWLAAGTVLRRTRISWVNVPRPD